MSLLMEALRKAEEAKRQAGSENAPAAPGTAEAVSAAAAEPTLTPPLGAPAFNPPAGPLPNLSQHFDAVDADLAAVSAGSAPKRQPAAESHAEERAAARNVSPGKPSRSRIPKENRQIAIAGRMLPSGIGKMSTTDRMRQSRPIRYSAGG